MIDHRCANKRRPRPTHHAKAESHLGDIVRVAPLEPMRPFYRAPSRCYVQRGVHCVVGVSAALIYGGLIVVLLFMLFWYYPATPFGLG